jgi:hypothetical protein
VAGGWELRRPACDEPVTVLHDFLLSALRHDALRDALLERMTFQADSLQLDPEGLAIVLPSLLYHLLDTVGKEDWIAVAEHLIHDSQRGIGAGEKVAAQADGSEN